MKRALFFAEFKRLFVPAVLVLTAVYLVVALVEQAVISRGHDPFSVTEAGSLFLLVLVVLSGFANGSRTFSSEFKEKLLPFFASLPLSPIRTWILVMLAGLSSSILALAPMVALRPGLLQLKPNFLMGHLALFAGGCCFALLFRKTLTAYLLGIPTLALMAVEMLPLHEIDGNVDSAYDNPAWVLFVCSAQAVACVCLSIRFFLRGELELPRVRVANVVLLAAALVGVVVTTRWIPVETSDPQEWMFPGFPRRGDVQVAPLGKILGVPSRSDGVEILSAESGERLGSCAGWPIQVHAKWAWTPEGDALWTSRKRKPWLHALQVLALTHSATRVGLCDADGSERANFDLDGTVWEAHALDHGRLLAVVDSKSDTRLVMLEIGRGIRELASVQSRGYITFGQTKRGVLICLYSPKGLNAWLFTDRLEPLETYHVPGVKTVGWGRFIHGKIYGNDQAEEEIARLYPRPSRGPGAHVFPDLYTDESSTVFYITDAGPDQAAELFAWRGGSWRSITHAAYVPRFGAQNQMRLQIAMSPEQGVAVFQVRNGSRYIAMLYDAGLDRVFTLAELDGAEWKIFLRSIPGLEGFLVMLSRDRGDGGPDSYQLYHCRPRVGVDPIKVRDPAGLLYLVPDHVEIDFDSDRKSVVLTEPSGAERILWEAAQGDG